MASRSGYAFGGFLPDVTSCRRPVAMAIAVATEHQKQQRLSLWRRLRRNRRGVAAVEFAMLAPIFIALLCGILENGLILLTQTVLDNATRDASRMILLGSTSSSAFATAVCNGVGGLIPCGSLTVNVQSGGSFGTLNPTVQTDTTGKVINTQFTPGGSGADVLVQVSYSRPFLLPIFGWFSGVNRELLVSTVALRAEPY